MSARQTARRSWIELTARAGYIERGLVFIIVGTFAGLVPVVILPAARTPSAPFFVSRSAKRFSQRWLWACCALQPGAWYRRSSIPTISGPSRRPCPPHHLAGLGTLLSRLRVGGRHHDRGLRSQRERRPECHCRMADYRRIARPRAWHENPGVGAGWQRARFS
jgi:hypothetical protein